MNESLSYEKNRGLYCSFQSIQSTSYLIFVPSDPIDLTLLWYFKQFIARWIEMFGILPHKFRIINSTEIVATEIKRNSIGIK